MAQWCFNTATHQTNNKQTVIAGSGLPVQQQSRITLWLIGCVLTVAVAGISLARLGCENLAFSLVIFNTSSFLRVLGRLGSMSVCLSRDDCCLYDDGSSYSDQTVTYGDWWQIYQLSSFFLESYEISPSTFSFKRKFPYCWPPLFLYYCHKHLFPQKFPLSQILFQLIHMRLTGLCNALWDMFNVPYVGLHPPNKSQPVDCECHSSYYHNYLTQPTAGCRIASRK